ncbi:metallophosphoesterase [Paenibacillus dokdonensis]|uniref:Metallophosphoesterase n=2 Tax=Paenibacillus dokdonensis TaxID=2567944 RepID=A0ABU6GWL8_9BACL|nr:fibronectin type III domain-containing protein [Paenibacillus dokdonensis]MEC0244096.1 metallophosphoesterase [Paenibacillus dokdonensis]
MLRNKGKRMYSSFLSGVMMLSLMLPAQQVMAEQGGGGSTSQDAKSSLAPVILEDFENGFDKYLPSAGAQFNKVNLSIEKDQERVRFGSGSLKLAYDFTGTTGTSGAYLQTTGEAQNIKVPGYPEKISMWVYGDGKKHWLRMQMLDAKGAVPLNFVDEHVGVDWVGWKYLEVDVPKGRTLPFSIDMPVRYMETSGDKKDAGAIYVDQIRALYGPNEDDIEPPVLSQLTPAAGVPVASSQPVISVHAEDAGYDRAKHPEDTQIEPDSIRMSVDGEQVQHILTVAEGLIRYQPEAPLADGLHRVKVSVRDAAGNQTIRSWSFKVAAGAPKFTYEAPDVTYAGNTYSLDIKGVKTGEISGGRMDFVFDPSKVENLRLVKGSMIDPSVIQAEVDQTQGTVAVTLNHLSTSGLTDEDLIGQVLYDVKKDAVGTNEIQLKSGSIALVEGETSLSFSGHTLPSSVQTGLSLKWDENGNVQGYETVLEVKNVAGNPVRNAQVFADGQAIGMTDDEGKLRTAGLTPAVKDIKLQAAKEGKYFSPVMDFTVSPLSGTPEPYSINVSMGDDPAVSRGFTWQTDPGTEGTVVKVAKQSGFSGFDQKEILKVEGTSELFQTLDIGTVRVHKASVTSLEPGTTYVYQVGDGKGHYSSQGSFQTAPASGDRTSFVYFADSQAKDEAGFKLWGDVVKQAFKDTPDAEFMIQAGDMVEKGFNEQEWKWWFSEAQEALLNTTLIAAIGNHEVMGTTQSNDFLEHFNQPGNGLSSLKGSSFSFDYKNIHFMLLNSEYLYEEQQQWLERDLASTNQKWKIAIFHRGPYGSIYDTEEVRNLWAPVLEKNKVDLVLNGHDHIYLRTHSMMDNQVVKEGEGTTYVVAGTSGPKFYPLTKKYWQLVTDEDKTQMYAAVEIEGDQLKFVTRTVGGRVVDQFTLTK